MPSDVPRSFKVSMKQSSQIMISIPLFGPFRNQAVLEDPGLDIAGLLQASLWAVQRECLGEGRTTVPARGSA